MQAWHGTAQHTSMLRSTAHLVGAILQQLLQPQPALPVQLVHVLQEHAVALAQPGQDALALAAPKQLRQLSVHGRAVNLQVQMISNDRMAYVQVGTLLCEGNGPPTT